MNLSTLRTVKGCVSYVIAYKSNFKRLVFLQRPRAFSESWVSDLKISSARDSHDDINMLCQYAEMYNTKGRIGVYTKKERADIIARFREKR